MINIRMGFKKTEVELSMEGHAIQTEGPNEICAAASMLAFTYCQNLRDMEASGDLEIFHAEQPRKGKAYAYGEAASPKSCEKLLEMATTIRTGFKLLAHTYPDNVRLMITDKIVGWGDKDT